MSRPPTLRTFQLRPNEIVVDCFAGGGGTSTGLGWAMDRPVDIAINHDPEAILMHTANHPETAHYCQDIHEVDPLEACAGRPVGLAWFSPECDHFSRAKGKSKKLDKKKRDLAWVVIKWAKLPKKLRPRIIMCENVQEFTTWGPLDDEGYPIEELAGTTFEAWLGALSDAGYKYEYRSLVSADYGTPTTRKRWYLIARCDGGPIVWPEETHGEGRAEPWRPAAEIIDWSLPSESIFAQGRDLVPATMARIAKGIQKFIIDEPDPFVIPVAHQGDLRVHSLHEPMRTITGSHRGEFSLVEPFITPVKSWGGGGNNPRSGRLPMRTITSSKRGEFAIVEPYIVRTGHYSHRTGAGLRPGCGAGTFRGQPLDHPLGTICSTNDKNLVIPIIAKAFGGPNGKSTPGSSIKKPLGAITERDHNRLVMAFLTKYYKTCTGSSMRDPMPTITSGGDKGGHHICPVMLKLAPGGKHAKDVRAFLLQYNGQSIGRDARQPLGTVTSKDRFGLVTIHGVRYRIVDICMRMLAPHELFAAQGFPDNYIIAPTCYGKPLTKTAQIGLAGNAVNPQVSCAMALANAA